MSAPQDGNSSEPVTHDHDESAALKHLAGSAILTVAGYAAGAAYGAVSKTGIKGSAAIGAGIGLMSSIGFGKQVYDGISSPFTQKPKSHVERLKERELSDKGRGR